MTFCKTRRCTTFKPQWLRVDVLRVKITKERVVSRLGSGRRGRELGLGKDWNSDRGTTTAVRSTSVPDPRSESERFLRVPSADCTRVINQVTACVTSYSSTTQLPTHTIDRHHLLSSTIVPRLTDLSCFLLPPDWSRNQEVPVML